MSILSKLGIGKKPPEKTKVEPPLTKKEFDEWVEAERKRKRELELQRKLDRLTPRQRQKLQEMVERRKRGKHG